MLINVTAIVLAKLKSRNNACCVEPPFDDVAVDDDDDNDDEDGAVVVVAWDLDGDAGGAASMKKTRPSFFLYQVISFR